MELNKEGFHKRHKSWLAMRVGLKHKFMIPFSIEPDIVHEGELDYHRNSGCWIFRLNGRVLNAQECLIENFSIN